MQERADQPLDPPGQGADPLLPHGSLSSGKKAFLPWLAETIPYVLGHSRALPKIQVDDLGEDLFRGGDSCLTPTIPDVPLGRLGNRPRVPWPGVSWPIQAEDIPEEVIDVLCGHAPKSIM
jgi:hypothetical protein